MSQLKYLLRKEFRQIFRNPTILKMIVALPIVQLLILPLAADYEIKNINIAIVDHDHSTVSRKLVNAVGASGYFRFTTYGNNYSDALDQIETDKADLILEIPSGFERNLVREGSQKIFVAVNAINGTKANVGGAYLLRIIGSFNQQLITEVIPMYSFSSPPVIEITSSNWYNRLLSYRDFMVPGILVILVTLIGVILCALNIVAEKEKGTIEQINVTPVKRYQFILGKLIPFWIIGMLVFSIGLLGVARLVYGIIPAGSLLVLYSFLAIYLAAVLGIGLTISAYSSTQQQAMSVAFFFMMIFLLMSGLFTPTESMPEWAKWITKFNPVTYFIEVMRMVVMKGSGFRELKQHFLVIICFAIVSNGWAVWSYRKVN
jgi:ABC-2 type transport system permease protein